MGIIARSNFSKALYPGVSKWYGNSYEDWETEFDKLFDSNPSKRAYEEDVGTSGLGLARLKTEGGSVEYDEERQAFVTRYVNFVYALGFIITREMVEDDLYGVIGKRRSESLARSMRQTKETIGANVYNRAFTSGYTGGDGSILCVSTHPNFAGGTWSNVPSTAADLSEATLEQAVIDIAGFEDDRGLKIKAMAMSLHIPVDLMFEAERILMTPQRPGTADNDINALARMGKLPRGYFVNHYFSDSNNWFIRTNVPNGMKYYTRRAMEFTIDNDFDTENAKFKATERYSFGWTDPRGIYGVEVA